MIDVFVDLSAHGANAPALHNLIARWARPEQLGGIARHITGVVAAGRLTGDVLLPQGWVFAESECPLPALSAALSAAGRDKVGLLVLQGAVDVSHESVGVLRQCLERDPMFGFSVPRIACADRCCFARLTRHGMGATSWLPRKILVELPESELMVEVVGPCILVSSEVAGNFGPLDRQFDHVAVAMIHYMATARRHGFRTVMANRAVVGIDGLDCKASDMPQPLPDLSLEDYTFLRRAVPDLDRSWQESRSASWERFETVCTSIASGRRGSSRPSLLLDARNAGPTFNGTTQAVLGVVQAIRALQPEWDVTLLAHPQGAGVHDLARVYAGWPVYTNLPDRSFTVTLRLSQPWHIREMVDLHRVSLFNAYLMLDTINWDIGYAAPRRLEGTWQFLADHADALLFDSAFTSQRFVERFQSARSVPSLVTHFSFDPKEYVRRDVSARTAEEKFILVVGNSLDHKDVRQTVEALVSVFPFRRIKALGLADSVSPFVTALQSGDVPDIEIHRLYASAEYVVYPSFYEGFGFPILSALAYGRTVLARRSALLEEVAAQCDRRGRLVLFERRDELVELLGRLVHGEAVPEYPLGLGLTNGRPKPWSTVARNILEFLESIVREPSRSRWIGREHAVQQLLFVQGLSMSTPEHPSSSAQILQVLLRQQYRDLARRGGDLLDFADVEFRTYSQNGEDGILLYLFSVLGTTNRKVVEICAGDGFECNAANLLINHAWQGLLVDGDADQVANGRQFYASCRNTWVSPPIFVHEWITAENVNATVARQGFGGSIDLVSLDLDGNDYWIWKALDCVIPRVVVIEFNNACGPDRSLTIAYQPDFRLDFSDRPYRCGASLTALDKLARGKGYRLVGIDSRGINAFFVRDGLGESLLPACSARECYERTDRLREWVPDRLEAMLSGRTAWQDV